MKLVFDKNEAGDITTMLDLDGEVIDFKYTLFVREIFEKSHIVPVEYSEKIQADEKEKLSKMIEEIDSAIKKRSGESSPI